MDKTEYTHEYMQGYVSNGLTMADSPDYKPTPQAQIILDALKEAGDWVNRSALATKLNKNALNKWDIILLGKLAGRR